MTVQEDYTAEGIAGQYTGLPLDEKIDAIIEAHESGDTEALASATLEVGDAQKFAWGMGRALKRLKERSAELQRQQEMVLRETEDAQARLWPNITFLEEQLDAMALERRESGAGNHLDIPGVGRWSTRQVKAGWDINDPVTVMQNLSADEYAEFVEPIPKLKTTEFRKHLDATGEVPDGVERRPERISVSYKLNGAS